VSLDGNLVTARTPGDLIPWTLTLIQEIMALPYQTPRRMKQYRDLPADEIKGKGKGAKGKENKEVLSVVDILFSP